MKSKLFRNSKFNIRNLLPGILALVILIMPFVLPMSVHAAGAAGDSYTLLSPLTLPNGVGSNGAIGPTSDESKVTGLADYLQKAFQIVVGLAGLIAVTILIIGGIEYVSSGISGNEAARSDAHKRIWDAITGLILAVSGYLILQTINPCLVQFKLTIPPIGSSAAGYDSCGAATGFTQPPPPPAPGPASPTTPQPSDAQTNANPDDTVVTNIGKPLDQLSFDLDAKGAVDRLQGQLCPQQTPNCFRLIVTANPSDTTKPIIKISPTQDVNQALHHYADEHNSSFGDTSNIKPYTSVDQKPSAEDFVKVRESSNPLTGAFYTQAEFKYDGSNWVLSGY